MLKNYLKVALRSLLKHRGYSAINVVGLAVGLACFTLIGLYVWDELAYDRHHAQADRIVRVGVELQAGEGIQRTAQSPPAWALHLPDAFPEVAEVVRFKPPRQTWMVRYEDRTFSEKGWAFADSTVFDVFDVPLRAGNPAEALAAPGRVVVSASMARKYFGGADPVGKLLLLDNQYPFEVSGVMADMPRRSHVHFDFLASFSSLRDPTRFYLFNADTGNFPFSYTYLLLHEGADVDALAARLPGFIRDHVPEQFRQGTKIQAFLQPLTDIHLHSNLENEIEPNGDRSTLYIFTAVAVFLLLIACVNFMNLTTARSAGRAKEVGMRKVLGAVRGALVGQFLGEALLLSVAALAVALGLAALALPRFNVLTGKALGLADLFHPLLLAGLLAVALLVGLVAGSYPAFFLSAFRPILALKGQARTGTGGHALLRRGLIVFQFAVSTGLLIATGVVYSQMDFVRAKKLGFEKENVVVVELTDPIPSARYPAFREAVLQHPGVVSVSASLSAPATLVGQATIRPIDAPAEATWQVHTYFSDFDFVETLGMEVLAGRTFSRDHPSDTLGGLILNETAARAFGWHDPQQALDRELTFAGNNNPNAPPLRVIGVVRDFHGQSVREQIAPAIIGYAGFRFFAFVRIRPGDLPGTLAALEQAWTRVLPGYAFDYSFLDQDFDRLYRSEQVLGELLTGFALLTVLIACLGLFGLASFTTEQRTKEIGIRKVLGASVPGLVVLLSKEFTKLVLVAFAVAAPLAYFAMQRWLSGFAYHIDVPWLVFVAAGVLALAVAWTTMSVQSIRAALADPVKTLRYE